MGKEQKPHRIRNRRIKRNMKKCEEILKKEKYKINNKERNE